MRHSTRYVQSLALLIVLLSSMHAESVLSPDAKTALESGRLRLCKHLSLRTAMNLVGPVRLIC
jgi:hypothetical protein